MNTFDKIVSFFSAKQGYKRSVYRHAQAAYEAAKPGRLRRNSADNSSGDTVVGKGGAALRGYARQLEQNYDVAKGALDVLVNNVVGPYGVTREPQPRNNNGEIHEDFAAQLMQLWSDWTLRPEVTWSLDYAAMERLACRTWLRDGEAWRSFLRAKLQPLIMVRECLYLWS